MSCLSILLYFRFSYFSIITLEYFVRRDLKTIFLMSTSSFSTFLRSSALADVYFFGDLFPLLYYYLVALSTSHPSLS